MGQEVQAVPLDPVGQADHEDQVGHLEQVARSHSGHLDLEDHLHLVDQEGQLVHKGQDLLSVHSDLVDQVALPYLLVLRHHLLLDHH